MTRDSPINLSDIVTLLVIDPLPFLTSEDGTEDNEDLEYFCQDEKEPSMPGQSSKDAIREMIGALDSLVGNLMEYRFNNRLYEDYKTKEQGDA